jgi:hypothetical protein
VLRGWTDEDWLKARDAIKAQNERDRRERLALQRKRRRVASDQAQGRRLIQAFIRWRSKRAALAQRPRNVNVMAVSKSGSAFSQKASL